MQIGALIVAAGMSSRMGDFKPMLNIGSISVAQRIIATLTQSGVSKIVMVTGYNAAMLERHLAGNGIIFLRNEDYETTQMFDSVRIGLRYLLDMPAATINAPICIETPPLIVSKSKLQIIASSIKLIYGTLVNL